MIFDHIKILNLPFADLKIKIGPNKCLCPCACNHYRSSCNNKAELFIYFRSVAIFFLTFGQQLFYGCGNISPGSALRPCLLRLSSLNLYINLYLRWRPGLKLLPVQKNPGMLPVGPAHQLCVSLGMCQEALATSPYSASLAKASGMAHLCLIFLINFKLECVKFNMGN